LIQVLEGRKQYIELAGNLTPNTKNGEPIMNQLFQAFHENRLPMTVRLRDLKAEPNGQVIFRQEPRTDDVRPTLPLCVLNVTLPLQSSGGGVSNGAVTNGDHEPELDQVQALAALQVLLYLLSKGLFFVF